MCTKVILFPFRSNKFCYNGSVVTGHQRPLRINRCTMYENNANFVCRLLIVIINAMTGLNSKMFSPKIRKLVSSYRYPRIRKDESWTSTYVKSYLRSNCALQMAALYQLLQTASFMYIRPLVTLRPLSRNKRRLQENKDLFVRKLKPCNKKGKWYILKAVFEKTLAIVEWLELVSNCCFDVEVLCIHIFLNYTVCNINLVTYTKLKLL